MPVIEHEDVRLPEVVDRRTERMLVSNREGAVSLTIKEVELHPGYEGRLHTHPIDVAMMVTVGAVQIALDDEIHTVRAGSTILAPPGVAHKLINNLWVPVRLIITCPSADLETSYLE